MLSTPSMWKVPTFSTPTPIPPASSSSHVTVVSQSDLSRSVRDWGTSPRFIFCQMAISSGFSQPWPVTVTGMVWAAQASVVTQACLAPQIFEKRSGSAQSTAPAHRSGPDADGIRLYRPIGDRLARSISLREKHQRFYWTRHQFYS